MVLAALFGASIITGLAFAALSPDQADPVLRWAFFVIVMPFALAVLFLFGYLGYLLLRGFSVTTWSFGSDALRCQTAWFGRETEQVWFGRYATEWKLGKTRNWEVVVSEKEKGELCVITPLMKEEAEWLYVVLTKHFPQPAN